MPHTQNKAASGEGDVVEIPPELVCRLGEGRKRTRKVSATLQWCACVRACVLVCMCGFSSFK